MFNSGKTAFLGKKRFIFVDIICRHSLALIAMPTFLTGLQVFDTSYIDADRR